METGQNFFSNSEIWPNLILNAKKRNIPIALINARLTRKSYDRWFRFSKTAKKLLVNLTFVLYLILKQKIFLKSRCKEYLLYWEHKINK